mgnify:CR=1 FL=1
MRQMTKGNTILNITQHIILRNGWEYYVTDNKHDANIVQCLVMGLETELGDVDLTEIRPHMISRTKDLSEVFPCIGWTWVA